MRLPNGHIIWPEYRMGEYRDDDRRSVVPHFSVIIDRFGS